MRLFRHLQPALAALLAACVMLLGLAAVSPELHQEICFEEAHAHHHAGDHEHDGLADSAHHGTHSGHHHDENSSAPASGDAEHGCAVHLFAHGCTTGAPALFISPAVLNATSVAHFTEFMLSRTLRGPARVCGPPALA